MNRKVRVVQYGCGRMGCVCMKFAVLKGAEIIGAYDINSELEGQDIGEYIGLKNTIGVKIRKASKFEKEIKELKPDIVIVTTLSLLKDIYDVLLICAENGINVITTCEEAIYPWNSSPEITKKLDYVAKKTGATISGSGAQELQWGSTINNIAAGVNQITKITGTQQNNIDDYGIAFAESFGAGMTMDEFTKKFGKQNELTYEEILKPVSYTHLTLPTIRLV